MKSLLFSLPPVAPPGAFLRPVPRKGLSDARRYMRCIALPPHSGDNVARVDFVGVGE